MSLKFSLLLLILSLSLTLLPCHCYKEEETSAEEEQKSLYPQIEDARKVYERCERLCERAKGSSSRHEYDECTRSCKQQYEHQREQQGGGGTQSNHHIQDPRQRFDQCQRQCDRHEQKQQKQLCQQKCQTDYERRKGQQGGEQESNPRKQRGEEEEEEEEEQQQQQETQNPYFFDSQRFKSKYKTQHGNIRVLERFTKKNEFLKGIENYRLAILEANPNTFVVPHHCDAESVFIVTDGKGTISYVWQDKRYSYNLKTGDVLRVPAGSIVYLINNDDNDKLYVLKLLQPVNTPGHFEEYFGVGGENPESFYRTFSNEILEAAFNTPRDRLEKFFGQQKSGVIIKASKEQIRALTQQSESTRGRKGESWGPFNLLDQKPLFSSQFGQFYEAFPSDFQQLKDLDVSVAFMNIKKGGMSAPYYNSRSTKLVYVVEGSGYYEMACPHIASQTTKGTQQTKESQEEARTDVHYQKFTARLSVGDAFVIPAGHPIAIVASQNSNLQLVGFGIKASFSQKYFLAGRENIWNQVHSEAKELSFKLPASEIEEIFRRQEQSHFLAGPGQKQEEGRGITTVASIMDFVGF